MTSPFALIARHRAGPCPHFDPATIGADPERHVIAGDALSPETTAALVRVIVDWLGERPELR